MRSDNHFFGRVALSKLSNWRCFALLINLFSVSGRIVVISVEQSDAGKFPRQSCFAGCRSQRWSRILERTSFLIYLQKDMDVNFLENLRISISVCLEHVVAILLEIVRERKRCACGAFLYRLIWLRAHTHNIYTCRIESN